MRNTQNIIHTVAVLLVLLSKACLLQGQVPFIGEHASRDVRHTLINKGDVFVFERRNTNTRNQFSSFERSPEGAERELFRISYPFSESSLFFFWLRHPLTIRPYTKYVLRLNARVDQLRGKGHYVEIAVFDETRETEVETHRISMNAITRGWKSEELVFTTGGKARFARLRIRSHPGGSGEGVFSDMLLEQISEPFALMPEPVVVAELNNKKIQREEMLLLTADLPADRNYYAISIDLGWKRFRGSTTIAFEWYSDQHATTPLVSEICEIRNIEGIQPEWDGVSVQWWKQENGPVDFISRKKDKLFNTGTKGGSGQVTYRVDRPGAAGVLRVVVRQDERTGGEAMFQCLRITAES